MALVQPGVELRRNVVLVIGPDEDVNGEPHTWGLVLHSEGAGVSDGDPPGCTRAFSRSATTFSLDDVAWERL